jgi:hypothetical protein
MKNNIFIAIILIGTLTSCLTDKRNNREVTTDMIAQPSEIKFDEKEFDFGKIAVGESVDYTFTFENVGEHPLLIHSVKAGCGCTIPENWPKFPVLPGETGKIDVEFVSKNAGKTKKYISVIANTRPAAIRLYLKGEVIGN